MRAPRGIEADFMDRLNVYMTTGLVILAIAVLVWLSLRIRSWFFDSDDSDGLQDEMLTQFRQLKREGELSDEEYRLISQRLSAKPSPSATVANVSQPVPKPTLPESDTSTNPSGD